MKRLLAILFVLPVLTFAQEENLADSIEFYKKKAQVAETALEEAIAYTKVGTFYRWQREYQSALFYLNRSDSLLDIYACSEFKIENNRQLARTYGALQEFSASELNWKKAIACATTMENDSLEIELTHRYIDDFFDVLPYTTLMQMTLDLKDKVRKKGNDEQLVQVLVNYNSLLMLSGAGGDRLEENASELLEIAERTGERHHYIAAYFQFAYASPPVESIKYYQKVIEVSDEEPTHNLSATYNNLSTRFMSVGNLDSALICARRAFEVSKAINRTEGVAAAYLNMARTYERMNEPKKAIIYADSARQSFQEANILRRQDNAVFLIATSNYELGNYREAYDNLLLAFVLEDSFEQLSMVDNTAAAENQFNFLLKKEKDSLEYAKRQELSALEIESHKVQLEKEETQRYALYGGIALLGALGFLIFINLQRKKRANEIIQQQKTEVEKQKEEISQQHNEIKDSIAYAKRIQEAILPSLDQVRAELKNCFVLYIPKDVVAGDFYWIENHNGKTIYAAADCTGHGVPGAMVSVVCHNALNRSVREYGLSLPNEILDKTRDIVKESLESKEMIRDGMDIALCSIDWNQKKLEFAGANNPVWIMRQGLPLELKPNKQPVGKFHQEVPFTLQVSELLEGDMVYTFSDGYADQFGGSKGKKFRTANLRKLLLEISSLPVEDQKRRLIEVFENWKTDHEQVDDICIIGVRI